MRRRALLAAVPVLFLLLTGAAAPAAWTFDRAGSGIDLSVRALGGTHTGRFEDWSGDLVLDPAAPAETRVGLVVKAGSLKMHPSIATGRAVGRDFLDAARFPDIRFQLRAMEPAGQGRFTAHGAVTMKGITRSVAFPLDLRVEGRTAQMTGGFTVDRTDFGIGTTGPWNRLVGRQVTVRVALRATR